MANCCSVCFSVLFILFELLVLAFTIAAQPVGFFKPKLQTSSVLCDELTIGWCEQEAKWCYTLWGYRADCKVLRLTATGLQAWGCKNLKVKMEVAEAFSIISILLATVLAVMGILMMCLSMKFIVATMIMCVVETGCLVISWGSAVTAFNSDNCDTEMKVKDSTKLGLGFVFLIIATVLQFWNVVQSIIVVACSCDYGSENGNGNTPAKATPTESRDPPAYAGAEGKE